MGIRGVWVLACALCVAGCGKKDDDKAGGKGGGEPAKPSTGGDEGGGETARPSAGAWNAGAVSFKAAWSTEGEATKKSEPSKLTGTFYVGADAVRLDIDVYPNSGGPLTLIRTFENDDSLWAVNASEKTVSRALSGDWTQDVVPVIVEADEVEDIARGECPFGHAKPDECKKVGDEKVAGRAVEKWAYKRKWTYWVDPALRTTLKLTYTPFRNNPGVQTVELSAVEEGAQDPGLFKVPADFKCHGGSFCDEVPR